jgi:hypothetical protein
MAALVLRSWVPEGAWVAVLLALTAIAVVLSAAAVTLAGRPGGRVAAGVLLGCVAATGLAAAIRIRLAVDRGQHDLHMIPIVIAGVLTGATIVVIARATRARRRAALAGVLAVAAVGMLVVAVFANLEAR